ncbi:MAG TPA: hypothetical protein VII01_14320 [Solirubrobacteraceae bacterium]
MAKRNTGRRARSRKRRPAAQATPAPPRPSRAPSAPSAPARASAAGGYRDPLSVGERPQAPWHPLPLSEILILVGAVGTIVGFNRGERGGGPVLFAGIGAVAIGTIEVTLREHLSGYRSHSILLATVPTIVFFTAFSLIAAVFVTPVPTWLRVLPIALAVPLFAVLFKLLRTRFLDARRERTFATRR